jgi:hypothetical protein
VAMRLWPREWMYLANAAPRPDEEPVTGRC